MENSYGIGIANRYELFYVDEEAGNPTNKIIKKAKQQKKLAAAASANVAANGGAGEKENKSAVLNKSTTTTTATTKTSSTSKLGKNGASTQNGQQITRNLSDRAPREAGKDNIRKTDVGNATQQNGENREQRYNRKNRENRENQPFNHHDNNTNNTRGDARRQGGGGGGNFGNERPPQNRRQYGKREFDRQSGSDKTGVKSIDKREGGGAHNWGTHKQDIDDFNKNNSADWDAERDAHKNKDEKATDDTAKLDNSNDQQTSGKDDANEQAIKLAAEEEAKEITLDEWKAQRAERAKPQYNLRKAGEGEDTTQWKKMIALQSRKNKLNTTDDNSDEEYEYDPSMYPQRVGRQKHVLDIDIHFNDGPRGGLNRRRGRPRAQRTWNGVPNANAGPIEGNTAPGTVVNAETEQTGNNANNANTERRRNQQSYRNRNERGPRRDFYDDRRGQNAPKVDDEHDFPSLG